MAHMSKRFNFDDFDKQIAEALDDHGRAENDARMAEESADLEEELKWAEHDRVPDAIGSVLAHPTIELPDPPEAA